MLAVVLEVLVVAWAQVSVAWVGAWEALALVLASESAQRILPSPVECWHASLHPGTVHRWLHRACAKPGLSDMVNSAQRRVLRHYFQPSLRQGQHHHRQGQFL